MENEKEFTNDKLVKNKLLSIILSKDKENILEIAYNKACCYKTSNILPGFTTENYKDIVYTQHLFLGNIKRDYYNFYTKINTWKASLILDENHTISKAMYRKVDIPNIPTPCEKIYINDNLTNDLITYISYLICEGDLNEYQKLLTNLDNKSKDYKAVLNGGKLYTNKIKSLKRQLTRK